MHFISEYKTIKKLQKSNSLRNYMRSVALDFLSLKNIMIGNNDYYMNLNRIQFIYIHHVFKDEEQAFEKLVKFLLVNHTPINYSEAVNKILNGIIDKPYIVFSTDDGFKNNLVAASILKKYGISACFFINPAIIGISNYEMVKEFCLERLNCPPVEFMNWDDISSLMKDGHEIGSHTQNHVKISDMPFGAAEDDINKSIIEIKKYCGKVDHFAYPYGKYHHFNERIRKFIFNCGFLSCASAERGCHITDAKKMKNEELFIRRDHIVLDWSLQHIIYFLVLNSKKGNVNCNLSPYKSDLNEDNNIN
jgi:peptidoglycan/xylan/chitin deacetylase (PgdA/CDA1 family)